MSENPLAEKEDRFDKLLAFCPEVADRAELLELVSAAHGAYVSGAVAGPAELATKFPKLPVEVLRRMVDTMGWRKQRIERLEDLQVSSAVRYAELIAEKRSAAAQGIIDGYSPVMKSIAGAIEDALRDEDNKFRMTDVRRLAESAAQLGGLVLQAAAADGKTPELPESLRETLDKSKGKRPWITVNASGPVTLEAGEKDLPGHDAPAEQGTGEEK